jgi:hypothetical protein
MSKENLQPGQHNGHGDGYEREDMGARHVFAFLIVLAVMGILVIFVANGMYRFLDHYERTHQAAQSPLRPVLETDMRDTEAAKVSTQINRTFPEPRLENDERDELTDFRMREEERLNTYGWVDQSAGTAHIPIDRAMQLIAERGLRVAQPADVIPAAVKGKAAAGTKKP